MGRRYERDAVDQWVVLSNCEACAPRKEVRKFQHPRAAPDTRHCLSAAHAPRLAFRRQTPFVLYHIKAPET